LEKSVNKPPALVAEPPQPKDTVGGVVESEQAE
jgi:hypothetical protein